MIQTFKKVFKGIEKVDLNAPLKLASSLASSDPTESLRGHKIRMEMEIVKNCDKKKHFLIKCVANALNKLPVEVVHAPVVNSFKEKIDNQSNKTNTRRTRSKVYCLFIHYLVVFASTPSLKSRCRS